MQSCSSYFVTCYDKLARVVTEEFWPFIVCQAFAFHSASVCINLNNSLHKLFQNEILLSIRLSSVSTRQETVRHSSLKWRAKSWLSIYVGHSLAHFGNVTVVYKPSKTGILPKFRGRTLCRNRYFYLFHAFRVVCHLMQHIIRKQKRNNGYHSLCH